MQKAKEKLEIRLDSQLFSSSCELCLGVIPHYHMGVKSAKEMVIAGGAYVQLERPWYWIGGFPREKMQTTGRL